MYVAGMRSSIIGLETSTKKFEYEFLKLIIIPNLRASKKYIYNSNKIENN